VGCTEVEIVVGVDPADERKCPAEGGIVLEFETFAAVKPHCGVSCSDAGVEGLVHDGLDAAPPKRHEPDVKHAGHEHRIADVRAGVSPVGIVQRVPVRFGCAQGNLGGLVTRVDDDSDEQPERRPGVSQEEVLALVDLVLDPIDFAVGIRDGAHDVLDEIQLQCLGDRSVIHRFGHRHAEHRRDLALDR
jgi:hypothetical protein